jgi:serine/threonine protein kinase/Tol biopolymer transport system component
MALSPGERFGSYEIAEAIGAGGMGEVYRATDTNLKRDVAIKVLPESFAGDADRLARFQREAEVLASLNHANIAQIYGLEKTGDQTVIVMELVEGPTLADRIAEGPIPPDEALGIARQVASALEVAHGAQVVHRDLKPANVKLKADGTVKVLDFGIAKAIDAQAISGGSPAMTTPAMTETGVILGTAAYMSPEQARGKLVDQRTDIWAFGCLLFEMLTGQPAFGGEDVMLTLARVLDRDTDMSSMPGTVSPAVRHTITLCLEKDPSKRISDIRDVRLALEGVFDSVAAITSGEDAVPRTLLQRLLPLTASAVIAALVVSLVAWTFRPQPELRSVTRFSQVIPDDQQLFGTAVRILDIAPDGSSFVYNTRDGFRLRALNDLEARIIPGSIAGGFPVYSPDSRSIAIYGGSSPQIYRIPITGGAPVAIASFSEFRLGLSWADDNTLLFAEGDGIWRVLASGGEAELVIPAPNGEVFFGPQLLPDGDSVLFSVARGNTAFLNWQAAQIVVESLSTNERTVLVNGGADARYSPTGHLIYAVGNDLFATALNLGDLTTSRGAVSILQGVSSGNQSAAMNFAFSRNGTLVYLPGSGADADGQVLVWVDRDGNETPFGLTPRNYVYVRISPEGDQIVALVGGPDGPDLWVSDVERPALSPITSSPGNEFMPLWTADGERVVYRVDRGGEFELTWTLADGTGNPESLLSLETGFMSMEGWSPNTREFVFTYGQFPDLNIGALQADADDDGERSWRPLIDRSGSVSMLSISPAGNWIVYQSDDSGDYGVYVEQFPDLGGRQRVSDERGGWAPVWSRDGNEIFYRRLGDGAMMAVAVETEPELALGVPELLFASQGYLPAVTPQAGGGAPRQWDVAPDGRFLMIKSNVFTESREFVVIENWFDELERLVPTE